MLTLSLQGRSSDARWSRQTELQTTNSAPKTYQFNEDNGPDIWLASFVATVPGFISSKHLLI